MLKIQCGGLIPFQVGSIPMHFRQKTKGWPVRANPLFSAEAHIRSPAAAWAVNAGDSASQVFVLKQIC